ncbi:hypothetical protein F1559_000646 [Cyanidiococcus yangmingshanensis]|uniref:AMP-dependent synthetase/ligase domain-containing protein n=1 Tax=Cyanidiococcus yangmingshanensis TaxID=2690220 RepID=A0A7J7IQU6_9RHOD|nr:hypothetical protein F1559_000646 [Cyanidiococcus yangmingshanensis]
MRLGRLLLRQWLRRLYNEPQWARWQEAGVRALHARAAAASPASTENVAKTIYAHLTRLASENSFKDAVRLLQTTRGHPMTFTTQQLNRHVRALAAGLRNELGMIPGDRIACWLPPGSAEFIVLALASTAARLELVVLPPPRPTLANTSSDADLSDAAAGGVVDDVILERALRMMQKYPARGLICWHEYNVIPRAVAARVPLADTGSTAATALSTVLYDNLDVPVPLVRALFLAPPTAAPERSPVTRDSTGLAGLTALTGDTVQGQPSIVPGQLEFVAHTGPENLRTLLRYRNLLVYDADPHPCDDNQSLDSEAQGTFVFCEPGGSTTRHIDTSKDKHVHLDEATLMKEAQALAKTLGGMRADHGDVAHGRAVLAPAEPERAHRVMITGIFAALMNGTLAIVPGYNAAERVGRTLAEKQGGALLIHKLP